VVRRMAEFKEDPSILARVGHLHLMADDVAAARTALGEAQVAAEKSSSTALQVQILADLAETNFLGGSPDEAQRAARAAIELGHGVPEANRAIIGARNSLGKVYLDKGDYARAARFFDDNLADASAHGLLFEVSRAHISCGVAALRSGDLETAESHYRAG